MSNQLASERLAYEYMLQRFKRDGNETMVRSLEAAPVTLEGGVPPGYLRVRDEAMHRLGVGTMREMRSVAAGLFFPSLRNRDYTLETGNVVLRVADASVVRDSPGVRTGPRSVPVPP